MLSLNISSESKAFSWDVWSEVMALVYDMRLESENGIGVLSSLTWSAENVSPWPTVHVRLQAAVVFIKVVCLVRLLLAVVACSKPFLLKFWSAM